MKPSQASPIFLSIFFGLLFIRLKKHRTAPLLITIETHKAMKKENKFTHCSLHTEMIIMSVKYFSTESD